jgi:hypothetical protein
MEPVRDAPTPVPGVAADVRDADPVVPGAVAETAKEAASAVRDVPVVVPEDVLGRVPDADRDVQTDVPAVADLASADAEDTVPVRVPGLAQITAPVAVKDLAADCADIKYSIKYLRLN